MTFHFSYFHEYNIQYSNVHIKLNKQEVQTYYFSYLKIKSEQRFSSVDDEHTISFPLAPVLRSLVSRGQKLFLEW